MNLDLSAEQTLLLTSLDGLLDRYAGLPTGHGNYVRYSHDLQSELAESGFLGIAREEGYGPLDAALLVERIARSPWSVEVAASALVSPALGPTCKGPLALCDGIGKPTRYLPVAKQACIRTLDGLQLAELASDDVEPIETVIAYPIGILRIRPKRVVPLDAALSERVYTLWQVAIATEAAGLMRGALDATTGYVKDRHQFRQPLGHLQAVQHRLAICEQIVSASYYLALRAAFSREPRDAAMAATFIQKNMRTIIYDCHQFTGAMGVTLEYPLHLWTYRLKYLQGELGGWTAQAQHVARACWGT
jgi:alkylation response protein AidB-like acyl-CoA dehydrogenase